MDELIYGHNQEKNIVAVQQFDESTVRIYIREKDTVREEIRKFYPFFFLSDKSYIEGFNKKFWLKKLAGNNFYQYACAFEDLTDMWNAIRYILRNYSNKHMIKVESYIDTDIIYLRPDPVHQFLLQTGITLFKGMEFNDVYRIQLDIETYSKHRFSNPERIEDRIILISLTDNRGWEYIIDGRKKSERQMLIELVEIIRKKDPDIIEGHNILNFDLPYLIKRAELNEVDLSIGRDGSKPKITTTTYDRETVFTGIEIYGRHIIDTLILVQLYDFVKREFESYSLKYVSKYFGITSEDRIYIPGEKIAWYWDNDPDSLVKYALQDAHETRKLSELLTPPYFYLTQMLPFSFWQVIKSGSSSKIESLLVRAYLKRRHSIPKPDTGFQTTGGYTDIFYTGVFENVAHADIESLYPSIMIKFKIAPQKDELGIFLQMLESLTKMRLEAKHKMKNATTPEEKSKYDAVQSAFKILINSFYGYLGYSRAIFNDYESADKVTTTGQKILKKLILEITNRGGKVIEADTDGIYFIPPEEFSTDEEKVKEFVKDIASTLPEGINLAFNGIYKKMLSYKKKNYALLDKNGNIEIKGASLISRGMEPFARKYISECVKFLLNNEIEKIHELYKSLFKSIAERKIDIYELAKTETLRERLDRYQELVRLGKRNRSAAYELAIASGRNYRQGDKITYYITGSSPDVRSFENCKLVDDWNPLRRDENVQYYLFKLNDYTRRFEVFFKPEDFKKIFSLKDGLNFDDVQIVTRKISREIDFD
ncbi:DNA polymerase elongation subunit (family B) [Candidatus Kryptobacter tengchongensis]|uniref:DNA-directed DNA polymerase n=1 Tax=Kryptobacter tengchongensis TaxID=1643429 RepID=A0A656DE06_KRYT1|nr:DNA polymerase domain-containing protein [Candidatus Kryptobacter tengchongensis]CUS89253.1 DNA polymerase elongation subunit (family B) [Candidatus Kryptobacter tengchongensis]CUT01501.1 DNA polymerase elongation subunit (family B) [Candidatus Kryptobacter tengchongensis]CUU01624.1 DNA polymerase elongation subunit (family B) [Candidatus Kryptobacter tengchongensis]CUU02153.1 DNA polymerase elongation subunit (family B) [Candidatus Kryptobacter tengchongensis]